MASLDDAQLRFLRDNAFVAVVTTVRADGGLHSTVVWVDVEERDAVFLTLRSRAKAIHLARDPRVSLLVADPANTYRWLAVSGRAELSEEKADARLDVVARKYLGRDEFPWRRPGEVWVDCRIRAERIEAAGIE
jgi:PPOX class probable F420-dependent enzyme